MSRGAGLNIRFWETVTLERAGHAAVAFLILCLGGCVAGPRYVEPSARVLQVPDAYPGSRKAKHETTIPKILRSSSFGFEDPLLATLVERATLGNLSVNQATERLMQAEEARVQARGAFFPRFSTDTTDGRNFSNTFPDSSSFAGQLRASWVIDLFGGLSRNKEASTRFLEAAGYDVADVRRTIAAQMAESYVSYRGDQARLDIARRALAFQIENEDVAKWRAMAGLVSDLDVQQARIQSARTATTIPSLELSLAQLRSRMAVLAGAPPGAIDRDLAVSAEIPIAVESIEVGVPADVLRSRPDVRAAERRLAGATALIGVAKAQLLPQLTLTGNIGTSASSVSSLLDVIIGGLFGGLSQSLFEGGQLRSRVRERRSSARESMANYRATLLSALQDVADSLAARDAARSRYEIIMRADAAADAAVDLARAQYRSGLTPFQSLLTAEQAWLATNDDVATAKADLGRAQVQMFLTLGVGWDGEAAQTTPAAREDRQNGI
jgi:outer membrane protein, multidrug efflux system